jgi:hypothetical protein
MASVTKNDLKIWPIITSFHKLWTILWQVWDILFVPAFHSLEKRNLLRVCIGPVNLKPDISSSNFVHSCFLIGAIEWSGTEILGSNLTIQIS